MASRLWECRWGQAQGSGAPSFVFFAKGGIAKAQIFAKNVKNGPPGFQPVPLLIPNLFTKSEAGHGSNVPKFPFPENYASARADLRASQNS
jgi:hypothetical protein